MRLTLYDSVLNIRLILSLSNIKQQLREFLLCLGSIFETDKIRCRRATKIHRYYSDDMGQGFIINKIEGKPGYYYMTAYSVRVKPGDYIEIVQSNEILKYQVEYVDYYSEPSDMWIGVLHEIL